MKKTQLGLIAIALLAVGFGATAAQNNMNNNHSQNQDYCNGQDNGNHQRGNGYHQRGGNGQGYNHSNNVVYRSSVTSETPNETLKKLAADVPALKDGTQYTVKVSIHQIGSNTNSAYRTTVTTGTATETLKKLVADAPTLASGGKYMVNVSVYDVSANTQATN